MNLANIKLFNRTKAELVKFKKLDTIVHATEKTSAVQVQVTETKLTGFTNTIKVRVPMPHEAIEHLEEQGFEFVEGTDFSTILDIEYPQGWRVQKKESLVPMWGTQEPKQKEGEIDMRYGVPHYVNFQIAGKEVQDILISKEQLARYADAEPQF